MHQVLTPKIMYFGTPVVLISTVNPDDTPNLAPMSAAWWIRSSAMLGMNAASQTVENLRREGECVLNLPSQEGVDAVDRLALTTGKAAMPEYKAQMGFAHVPDKFGHAGLTPGPSGLVRPPRVMECPVQLEAVLERLHDFGDGGIVAAEVRVVRAYFEDSILDGEKRHHVDTDRWRPLIMTFCEFYGLGGQLWPSRLANVF